MKGVAVTTAPRAELLKIPAVRDVLGGTSRAVVYDLIKRGELRQVHIGRSSFVTRVSLEEYLARLDAQAAMKQPVPA